MTKNALEDLLATVVELVRAKPKLRDFAPWPKQLPPARLEPVAIPAISLIEGLTVQTTPATSPIVDCIKSASREVCWQQTYSEAEVGVDFLNRYGWFELVGPTGHFRSDSARVFIAFWGAGLHYPAHLHEAEELYYVLAGSAEFHSQDESSALLVPEGTRYHASNQGHAMDTHTQPVLTLVLWRGRGLDGSARIATS
jgi:hypothetical protein